MMRTDRVCDYSNVMRKKKADRVVGTATIQRVGTCVRRREGARASAKSLSDTRVNDVSPDCTVSSRT